MKYLKFFFSLILVLVVFYGLNTRFEKTPAFGKFLNPVSGFWQNDKSANDTKTISIDGLKDEVQVFYDRYLIPHIFANNDSDLYKAQGYITAKHRLWQMEFQTLAAAGRLAEIFGSGALEFDRSQRRKGMGFGADNAIAKIRENPEILALLEAYRDGVNTYISQLKPGDIPVEYKLLGYTPEPWSIYKTAYLLMYMTDMLAGGDHDLEYTNLLRDLGRENFDLLFPDYLKVGDPVIPDDPEWSTWNVKIPETPDDFYPSDTINDVISKPNPDNGSNNWAVGPSRSYSGKAILANDPHLGLKLPSIWFVMQLTTPEKNTFGVTLPGALGIIIGFNNKISWGVTNATRDVKDWYKITFKDSTKAFYAYGHSWKPTKKRIEKIKVRGGKTYTDTVFYTHHGPVSYDKTYKGNGELTGYAMKWTGHIGSNFQQGFLELNQASNYEEYKNALKNFVAPAQNFIFSSVDGDIALWVQGKFPNKWKGQGKFLMDGSNPAHDWQGFIPQEYNAHSLNPERGFLSSANQRPAGPAYPYYVFNDGYETYRNRVINNYFRSKEKFNIQDFKDLHNNTYNLKAAELLPAMIAAVNPAELSEEGKLFFDEVSTWDYYNDIEKTGPTVWEIWWKKVYRLIWDELEGKDERLSRPNPYRTIFMLNNMPENKFMDIVTTEEKETAEDLFRIGFERTVKNLAHWKGKHGDYRWGKYKGTYIGHLLQDLPAFSRFDIPIGGNNSIVNATSKNHGPSWRMIVEMTSPPKAIGIYPGGQSGNPGSKHYDDFIDLWAKGDYINLLYMQSSNDSKDIVQTQILTPK